MIVCTYIHMYMITVSVWEKLSSFNKLHNYVYNVNG